MQSITLISKSKRENTRIVAIAYAVQVLIFFSVIGMFSFAVSLPVVQKFQGLGLLSGLDFAGLVSFSCFHSFLRMLEITSTSEY